MPGHTCLDPRIVRNPPKGPKAFGDCGTARKIVGAGSRPPGSVRSNSLPAGDLETETIGIVRMEGDSVLGLPQRIEKKLVKLLILQGRGQHRYEREHTAAKKRSTPPQHNKNKTIRASKSQIL